MLRQYIRSKAIIILCGIAMIVLGIGIFLNPIAAIQNLIRIIGWVFVGIGVVTIVTTILSGNASAEIGLIVGGAIFGLVGAGMAMWPGFFGKTVWTILGILVLITGILDIVEASDARSKGNPLAIPATMSGVVTMILGIICVVSPMFFPELGMLIAAVTLLIDGITEVIFGLGM